MRRIPSMFITREELADLYSNLLFFNEYYDDGEEEVKSLCSKIKDIDMQEFNETLDDANYYLHNRRGAGRKSKLTAEDKARIKQLKHGGKSVEDISKEYGVTGRYIYRLIRQ